MPHPPCAHRPCAPRGSSVLLQRVAYPPGHLGVETGRFVPLRPSVSPSRYTLGSALTLPTMFRRRGLVTHSVSASSSFSRRWCTRCTSRRMAGNASAPSRIACAFWSSRRDAFSRNFSKCDSCGKRGRGGNASATAAARPSPLCPAPVRTNYAPLVALPPPSSPREPCCGVSAAAPSSPPPPSAPARREGPPGTARTTPGPYFAAPLRQVREREGGRSKKEVWGGRTGLRQRCGRERNVGVRLLLRLSLWREGSEEGECIVSAAGERWRAQLVGARSLAPLPRSTLAPRGHWPFGRAHRRR